MPTVNGKPDRKPRTRTRASRTENGNPVARGFGEATFEPHESLPLGQNDRLVWFDEFIGGMLGGGIYLLGGSPGGRKSGLATQIVLELAAAGIPSISVLTEESERRFFERAAKLSSDWPKREAQHAMGLARCDARISDLEQLPGFLLRDVLSPNGRYAGSRLVVIDSVQGHATPGTAMRMYARLFEFDQLARAAGIAVILICQLTKSNGLSGPRALEHHADVVLQLAKVGDFRVLSLTKNRFGPEQANGVALLIDPVTTALRPSPHITPVTGAARTYMGSAIGESEIQASVSLPTPGSRLLITAPGLPRRRVELILAAISGLPMLDLGSFSMSVSALLPGVEQPCIADRRPRFEFAGEGRPAGDRSHDADRGGSEAPGAAEQGQASQQPILPEEHPEEQARRLPDDGEAQRPSRREALLPHVPRQALPEDRRHVQPRD
ncbi:MAG TPA: ATPase domain-containing protein [Tepidisphaeraceae bacterium]|nr:ATPase domain-containing protein [Tepidisphaeraceae bacterium]